MDRLLRDEAWSRNAVHQPNSNHVFDLLETTPTASAKAHEPRTLDACIHFTTYLAAHVHLGILSPLCACLACHTCAAPRTPSPSQPSTELPEKAAAGRMLQIHTECYRLSSACPRTDTGPLAPPFELQPSRGPFTFASDRVADKAAPVARHSRTKHFTQAASCMSLDALGPTHTSSSPFYMHQRARHALAKYTLSTSKRINILQQPPSHQSASSASSDHRACVKCLVRE